MTRRTTLPSSDDIELAITHITETTGRPPSALALARHVGLANTTFRRHFPDITANLSQQRSRTATRTDKSTSSNDAGMTQFERLQRDNAELRRTNHDLTEHLDLAVANIQRLTLDNHQLRQELEATTGISRIGAHHRAQPHTSGQDGHA